MDNYEKIPEFEEIQKLREMGYDDEEIGELVQLSVAIELRKRKETSEE